MPEKRSNEIPNKCTGFTRALCESSAALPIPIPLCLPYSTAESHILYRVHKNNADSSKNKIYQNEQYVF